MKTTHQTHIHKHYLEAEDWIIAGVNRLFWIAKLLTSPDERTLLSKAEIFHKNLKNHVSYICV